MSSELDRIANLLLEQIRSRQTLAIGTAQAASIQGSRALYQTPSGIISAIATNFCYGDCLLAKVEGTWYAVNPVDNRQVVRSSVDRLIRRNKSFSAETRILIEVEFVVFSANYNSVTTSEVLGIYDNLLNPLSLPPAANEEIVYPQFAPTFSLVGGVLTEITYQASVYVITLYNRTGATAAALTQEILYSNYLIGAGLPSWWANSFGQGSWTKTKQWTRYTTVRTPQPVVATYSEAAFYVEGSDNSFWSSSSSFPGQKFPINSYYVHEIQIDPSKINGNLIKIYCVPISPLPQNSFGVRTSILKDRDLVEYIASLGTPLQASSDALGSILAGSPSNSKTAFILNYDKTINQFV